MNNGGDVLARGGRSANFAGAASVTQFEDDLIFRMDTVAEKYGLTQEEVDRYEHQRLLGEVPLPDLQTVTQKLNITIVDRRPSYLDLEKSEEVKEPELEFPKKEYMTFQPILDRVLVMRVPENEDFKILEDGSAINKKTGLVVAAKYRQHSTTGIVLATGAFAVLGGQIFKLGEFVTPGDRVTFGDYNSEVFRMDPVKAKELCRNLEVNYSDDEEGIRIVRIQDIRGVEREVV